MDQNWNSSFDVTNLDTPFRRFLTAPSPIIPRINLLSMNLKRKLKTFGDHYLIPTEMHPTVWPSPALVKTTSALIQPCPALAHEPQVLAPNLIVLNGIVENPLRQSSVQELREESSGPTARSTRHIH
jgi:hypothetical protein